MWLLDFLFGKKPKINFGKDGRASHDLPNEKWLAWKDRFAANPEYDWRVHSGAQGNGASSAAPKGNSPKSK